MNSARHLKRLQAEKRFRAYGLLALGFSVCILVLLLGSIVTRGLLGFTRTEIQLAITFDAAVLGVGSGEDISDISAARFNRLVRTSLAQHFPYAVGQAAEMRQLAGLVSSGAGFQLKRMLENEPALMGSRQVIWLPASSPADLFIKGDSARQLLNDGQQSALLQLKEKGLVHRAWNTAFFAHGDSRSPERAGFWGAITGSFFTLVTCLSMAFPVGVMTAIYLEEFARKGRLVDIIEVNINNLAAVPSIVFGLLGLAVYINVMGLPRSSSLVGGVTLALMILPVIIIATRASLKAIPDSIRDAARALGASPMQVVWHHTLPLAMPGIMTGTILGMARAIGETAPLLMIGMVAFVADVPDGFTAPASVMPVQIYLWASSPEAGFAEKTAAGILVLILLLLCMNALAIYLRKRFEVRW